MTDRQDREPLAGPSRTELPTAARSWVRSLAPRAAGGQVIGMAIAQVGASLCSALWLFVAARHMTRISFGNLTLMTGLVALFVPITDLGLSVAFGLHVTRRQLLDPRMLRTVVSRRLVLSLGVAVLTGVLYMVAATGGAIAVPLIFAVVIFAASVTTTITTALRSLDRTHVDSLNLLVSRIGVLILGYLLVTRGGGLNAASVAYAAVSVGSVIAVSLVVRRHVGHDPEKTSDGELAFRRTYPFAVAIVAGTLYASIDIWILALLKGTAVSGGYAAADKILDAVLLPSLALVVLVQNRYPRLEERVAQTRFLRRLALASVGTVVLPVIVVSIFAGQIMALFYGHSFRSDGAVLVVLLLSAPAGAMATVLPIPAILRSRAWYLTALLAGLVVNIVCNFALIPRWGAIGAGVANLAADMLVAVGLAWLLLRSGRLHRAPQTQEG
jgi:PST family polysaccharide transporter